MRGKESLQNTACRLTGITPAYAGKSLIPDFCVDFIWDHPRVCGEKSLHLSKLRDFLGSPPRMRGKESFEVIIIKS